MKRERSPGMKLMLAGLVAAVLIVPLMMVYALVYDRESQSARAQAQIAQGWGGPQNVTGPVLVVPITYRTTETETVDGTVIERSRTLRRQLFVSPTSQSVETAIDPDRKGYAIYESVVYQARMSGTASFDFPTDLEHLGVEVEEVLTSQAQLRFGVSDTSGLVDGAQLTVDGEAVPLEPGNGPDATGGSGFSANVEWSGEEPLDVRWQYGVRGTQSLGLIPRGGETAWRVTSPWPHPSFTGTLPDPAVTETGSEGFTAVYPGITNLSLGRGLVSLTDDRQPSAMPAPARYDSDVMIEAAENTKVATIALVDPVDLYSQVDRAVKYGFLFIGFTFATFLMFDIVGGARVASAEYLLTGAGLVLFFVMLLAFAEVWGFTLAYLVASAAIIGLLTPYSAAVLGTWRRASFIGLMLAGLYALLYVLLNLETYSLVIGSVLLFAALAGIMYGTRSVDWGAVGRSEEGEGFAPS